MTDLTEYEVIASPDGKIELTVLVDGDKRDMPALTFQRYSNSMKTKTELAYWDSEDFITGELHSHLLKTNIDRELEDEIVGLGVEEKDLLEVIQRGIHRGFFKEVDVPFIYKGQVIKNYFIDKEGNIFYKEK